MFYNALLVLTQRNFYFSTYLYPNKQFFSSNKNLKCLIGIAAFAVQIISTLGIRVAYAERPFSGLQIINNYLKSSMS